MRRGFASGKMTTDEDGISTYRLTVVDLDSEMVYQHSHRFNSRNSTDPHALRSITMDVAVESVENQYRFNNGL